MNRHNLPLAGHAANKYGGWLKVKGCNTFRLSYISPMGLASIERITA